MNESNSITYDQETELAGIFRPNTHIPIAVQKLKAFLDKPEVKEYADNNLQLVLIKHNIDANFLIEKRKEILEEAKKAKQYNAANIALDRLEAHVLPKITITETRTTKNSNLEENYNKAKQEIKVETVKNEENSSNKE